MRDEWPRFRVFAVKEGEAWGLLVKRQKSQQEPEDAEYFWLHAKDGLTVTPEIAQVCGEQYHMLSDNECNRSFVELIFSYVKSLVRTGMLKTGIQTIGPYQNGEQCGRIIDHFFERGDQELAEFFRSGRAFKQKVLGRVSRPDELIGQADEFRVLSTSQMVVPGDGYLRDITHVLKCGRGNPEWFRGEGPIQLDFDAGLIYPRRTLLDQLRALVLGNSFSLLEGNKATGKTVLLRQLGYELSAKEGMAVYWFDGDLERGFDRDRLIREINSLRGIFIIENTHIETEKYQRVLYSVRPDSHRHVLFTARPSFRESENTQDWLLSSLPQAALEPFSDADEMIAHFAGHHPNLPWDGSIRDSIKDVSREDYWVLSQTLLGYIDARGEGEPRSWPKQGVHRILRSLERKNRQFPEIVVAMAIFYREEARTEEQYLVRTLDFDPDILQELVVQGEVTQRTTEEGYVFYGLHHSALADLFWEYGTTYKRRKGLLKDEDSLYLYAKSDVPNGLAATLLKSPDEAAMEALRRLNQEPGIVDIIRRETSIKGVGWWVLDSCSHGFLPPLTDELLEVIAEKIVVSDDYRYIVTCIMELRGASREAGRKLWRLIDPESFADKLSRRADAADLQSVIGSIYHADPDMGKELLGLLNWEEIASRLRETGRVSDSGFFLVRLFEISRRRARWLCRQLVCKQVAERLSNLEFLERIPQFLGGFRAVDPKAASRLCTLLDIVGLAERLNKSDDRMMDCREDCPRAILHTNKTVGRRLSRLVNRKPDHQ